MKAHDPCLPWNELWRQFETLNAALESSDVPMLKRTLTQMLPGYQPHVEVVDWVHMERHRVRDRTLPLAAAVGVAQVGEAEQPPAPNQIAVAI